MIVPYSSQSFLGSWIGVQQQNFAIGSLRVTRKFSGRLFVITETSKNLNSQKVLYSPRYMLYLWMPSVIWGAVKPVASGEACPWSAGGMHDV